MNINVNLNRNIKININIRTDRLSAKRSVRFYDGLWVVA